MKTIEDLKGPIYLTCSACMSVWADGLSWANANPNRCVPYPEYAKHIVVLSCQVTDLAILNDLRTAESYQKEYKGAKIYISGCLAQRQDIELPAGIQRLETPRCNGQKIRNRGLVNFEKPFWVKDFSEDGGNTDPGHLFRRMYPLRIGKGCTNKCTYCTIRITRGEFEEYPSVHLMEEFLEFDDILLIADNPLPHQVKEWAAAAFTHGKPFSIRNVEPRTAVECAHTFVGLAESGLLKVFHAPIQSVDPDVLKDMNRSVADTRLSVQLAATLKSLGVYVATNIIIDYKDFEQDFSKVYDSYDYVSWNPYWDGKWDRAKAEERWAQYFEAEHV